jgi:hypothetical protein
MLEPDTPTAPTAVAGWKIDAVALAALLLLVLPVRLWLIGHTEVAALDSIGYIRYALQFERLDWRDVCKGNHQHPGYSLAVLTVSEPLRWASGRTDADTMRLASQLASLLAALLLLYPMYHLGRVLFDRRVGFAAALLFQYFPISGHHLSDGISETLFLLLVASALLHGVQALNGGGVVRFAACGFFGGLAYLTRPEGAMVPAAVGLILLAMAVVPAWRLPWRRHVTSAAALLITTVAVGSVYVYATGKITNKLSVEMVIAWVLQVSQQLLYRLLELLGSGGDGSGPALFALTFRKADRPPEQLALSVRALALEIGNGFHYAGIVPALIGLYASFSRLRRLPGPWALAIYCAMHATALLAVAMTLSYVSDRHVMVLVLCGSYLVAAGLCEIPRRVLAYFGGQPGSSLLRSPAFWSILLLVGLIGFCLPKTLQPLHANRAGNHLAGLWLAERLQFGDIVDDDHCWSHYYAGQVFEEGKDPLLPRGAQPTCYCVRTRSRDPEINQKRLEGEETLRQKDARLVWHWPANVTVENARVVIYALPRDPKQFPWREGP